MEPKKIPELMTRREVCETLHVSKSTLDRWSKNGYLPRIKLGSRVMYSVDIIEKRFFISSKNSE